MEFRANLRQPQILSFQQENLLKIYVIKNKGSLPPARHTPHAMPISPTQNEYTFRLYNIRYRQTFFNLLSQALLLPDYFGGNWNALDDCMRDLSWLPEHDLTLTFPGLAHVPQPLQTQITDSLALWRAYWQAQTVKTVRILF